MTAENETGAGDADVVGANDDTGVEDPVQISLEQQLEMALTASRATLTAVTCQPSDADRQTLAAIKAEMAVFASSGRRGRFLQQAYDYLMTIPAMSVEAERAFSAAGIICSKPRSRLGDTVDDTLAFLRSYYRDA